MGLMANNLDLDTLLQSQKSNTGISKMKLLIINQHPTDALGGSEMQCDLIARGLAERGHKVIYGAVGRKQKESYSELPYTVVPLAIEKRGELFWLLQQEKPDVIYWRYNKHHLLQAVRESKRANVPFVFAISSRFDATGHPIPTIVKSGLLNKFRFLTQTAISYIRSNQNFRAFHDITAITTLNSQYIGKLPVKKQRIIWNSVSDNKEPFEWKKPYCVWVANIKPSKQPEAYIALASLMIERCPKIDFLMIGAIQSEQYKSIIEAAENMKNFHYLGFQPPEVVNGVLEKAKCLVHTCKPEGFGNNFIQAWMQGCPTISLEFDPDGLIQREQLGFLSGTVEQMASDVELLLQNKILRDETGNRAQAFARANFTPKRMVDEVELFLEEVINDYKVR